jgi:aminodeoxychorismate synthase component I
MRGPSVFLHRALVPPGEEPHAVAFAEPRGVITCRAGEDVGACFAAIERALDSGLHAAGAFAYELGHFLEPRLAPLAPPTGTLLLQVGLFARADRLGAGDAAAHLAARAAAEGQGFTPKFGVARDLYIAKVRRVLDYIAAGDIYQVNLTFPLCFTWNNGPWALYARLAPHQRVAFGAVLDLPDLSVASLSPELFFRTGGGRVEARPMKGTAARGATPAEDRALAEGLAADPKNRAENLMIVDLIRNDVSRIARIGSVRVDSLFAVETYETLHQMTSSVAADVAQPVALIDMFRALFPCGSVTGAPKIRAMEIIAELEGSPRGVYTGAIGSIAPDRSMTFSVPIRTVALGRDGVATMGIGSGIVADSDPGLEYEECLLKAAFLARALG